jgi:hypothetical protein
VTNRQFTSENDVFSEVNPGSDFREHDLRQITNPRNDFRDTEPSTAETPPRRRGARPTPLPAEYAEFLDAHATALEDVPLANSQATYISRGNPHPPGPA